MATFKTRSDGNIVSIVDRTTHETLIPYAPVYYCEDFLGQAIDVTNSPLAFLDTAGGAETVSADGASGALSLALDATSEAQLAGVSCGDQRTWILNQNLVFEARFKLSVLPTSGTIFNIGLMGDHNATADTVAENIWVRAEGSGALTAESDDTAADNNDIATGVTLTTSDWCVVRIDCSNIDDVKFYLNGERVASGTTFDMGTTAGLKLQPVVRLNKASGTSVGTVLVDYIKLWQNRS
jgi:hypothetical protein